MRADAALPFCGWPQRSAASAAVITEVISHLARLPARVAVFRPTPRGPHTSLGARGRPQSATGLQLGGGKLCSAEELARERPLRIMAGWAGHGAGHRFGRHRAALMDGWDGRRRTAVSRQRSAGRVSQVTGAAAGESDRQAPAFTGTVGVIHETVPQPAEPWPPS